MATTRGTTPTHIFTTDIDLTTAEVVYVTYKQGSKTVIEKSIDEMEITESSISIYLTQEETLAFKDSSSLMIQIRARFPDGTAVASNIINSAAGKILKEGVI